MPAHHDVRASDVLAPRLHASLTAAANRGPADFAELLLVPGVGARTVRALAMVAEVIHGAPYRFTDPARFSFAHGGKDRHPFPVPLKVYDETIRVLKTAVQKAKLGRDERLAAIKRLDDEARRIESSAGGPPVAEIIAEERRLSHSYAGRSVFGWEPAPDDGLRIKGQRRSDRCEMKLGAVLVSVVSSLPPSKDRCNASCARTSSCPAIPMTSSSCV